MPSSFCAAASPLSAKACNFLIDNFDIGFSCARARQEMRLTAAAASRKSRKRRIDWRSRERQRIPAPNANCAHELLELKYPPHQRRCWGSSPLSVKFTETYDVIVVGAGHAGCEAAMAAARMGLNTALFTLNLDLIAQMSCNPAIGGIAKGHLVREVDALGGIMGEVTDAVGIQFRLLNTSRGPAVWSPRAQCDKKLYRQRMKEVLEMEPNLRIKQAEAAELIVANKGVSGVKLRDGRSLTAGAVIVTTGA